MILQFMCSSKLFQKSQQHLPGIQGDTTLTAPRGFGTQHLHICCIQWILPAPGTLARKASPAWALAASSCRFRTDFLCTLQGKGKGMENLPGMTQQQKGFRKGNVPAPSRGDRDKGQGHSSQPDGTACSRQSHSPSWEAKSTQDFTAPEQTGLHALQIIPVPGGFGIPGLKHKQPSSRFHPDKDSHHTRSAASTVLTLPALLMPGQCWHIGVRSR